MIKPIVYHSIQEKEVLERELRASIPVKKACGSFKGFEEGDRQIQKRQTLIAMIGDAIKQYLIKVCTI